MITRPTVLVLGAGASKPYGFPTGREIADQIIGALLYPALRTDMIQMSQKEAERITWKESALKVLSVYDKVTRSSAI